MRHAVTVVLLAMLGALATLLYVQRADGEAGAPVAQTASSAPAGSAGAASDKPGATPVASIAAGPAKPVPPRPPPLARAIRTVALGWELLAPGVLASDAPAGAPSAYKTAGLEVSFANATSMDEVEAALARGGGDATGADLAIVPLSSYAASYERLRALTPELMFVVGWSRGREALFGRDLAALARPPATGSVRLAATAGRPETLFALVMLDLAGVPPSRIELVDPPAALTAALRTTRKPPSGKLLVSSADTPRLMPLVAVVPHGFAAAHAAELEAWTRAWLGGVAQLHRDPPAAGRLVATLPGAPPVLGVIEALGQLEFASLRENAAAFGLSGRGALTLDEICRTTWRIWRDTGVITTPVPEAAPLFADVVAALVRADPAAVAQQPPPRDPTGDTARRPDVLLVVRTPPGASGKLDADAFVTRIGLLAGIFDRLQLRVAAKDGPRAAELLTDLARDRFGLRPDQLVPSPRPAVGAAATIDVLAPR